MDDEELLAALAEVWREVGDLVDGVGVQGRGVYTWRTIDDDLALAELIHDSRLAPTAALRTAGEHDEPRVLVFTSAELSVELEITVDRVLGQLVPPGPAQAYLEHGDGQTIAGEADEYGFFVMPRPPTGAVRLRCETGSASLRTEWISL